MAERAGSAQEQTVETCARMEGPRSHLGRTFLDAVKIPAGSVEIMFIGKRGAEAGKDDMFAQPREVFLEPLHLSLIHISEPTRLGMISYAVFCLKKKKKKK